MLQSRLRLSPDAIVRACGGAVVTRFAPAPTGYLHLGHVLNALYVWCIARATGGRVLLRVEDHDRERSRAPYERALLEDLAWLGFVPDAPPVSAFHAGRCEGRQSDRGAGYAAALERLRAAGLVYACDCTRAAIAAASRGGAPEPLAAGHGVSETLERRGGASGPRESADPPELRYPGTCRDRGLAEGKGVGVRLRLPDTEERFGDLRCGPQAQRPTAQCGDLLLRDRVGCWTYQFCAAVDDHLQGVTLVVRGTDLLASTGRQILLARMLGRERPAVFLHHPLIMQTATQKLSKSDGATGVRDLRAEGWTAEQVIAEAARRGGLLS